MIKTGGKRNILIVRGEREITSVNMDGEKLRKVR